MPFESLVTQRKIFCDIYYKLHKSATYIWDLSSIIPPVTIPISYNAWPIKDLIKTTDDENESID